MFIWYKKHIGFSRLCWAAVEYLQSDERVASLYREGKRNECYQKMIEYFDSTIKDYFDEREKMLKEFEELGLLNEQLCDTFASWIYEEMSGYEPSRFNDYAEIVGERLAKVFQNNFEGDFWKLGAMLELWGYYMATDGVSPAEDLKDIAKIELRERIHQVAAKLEQLNQI